MNALAKRLLKTLQESAMGDMSEPLLIKQSTDMGINLDKLDNKDLEILAERLKRILPFFIGKRAEFVLAEIESLKNEVLED